jgi:hypothetical protein
VVVERFFGWLFHLRRRASIPGFKAGIAHAEKNFSSSVHSFAAFIGNPISDHKRVSDAQARIP